MNMVNVKFVEEVNSLMKLPDNASDKDVHNLRSLMILENVKCVQARLSQILKLVESAKKVIVIFLNNLLMQMDLALNVLGIPSQTMININVKYFPAQISRLLTT